MPLDLHKAFDEALDKRFAERTLVRTIVFNMLYCYLIMMLVVVENLCGCVVRKFMHGERRLMRISNCDDPQILDVSRILNKSNFFCNQKNSCE